MELTFSAGFGKMGKKNLQPETGLCYDKQRERKETARPGKDSVRGSRRRGAYAWSNFDIYNRCTVGNQQLSQKQPLGQPAAEAAVGQRKEKGADSS
ncbi:hypothetical protein CXIVA_13690 [Clostridium sp. SY8519]|nr:hypothetical protein CXIVA_13690 [Clostridium sp. SY8519]